MEHRHLPNAPITEALLDLRVELPGGRTVEDLDSFHGLIKDRYPTCEPRIQFQAQLNPVAGVTREERTRLGSLCWTSDRLMGVQARVDGFTMSRLKPYEDWEQIRDEARRLWATYVEVASPTRITRVAVRYINRMELPRPVEFEQYLTTFPKLGDGCPQSISGLLMRVLVAHERGSAWITEAIDEQGITESAVPVILDIDAFREVDLPIEDADGAWAALEELHRLKNDVFFGSLTEEAVGLFL